MNVILAEQAQATTVPRCVYCDSKMSAVLADRLGPTTRLDFICIDCGWKASVPLAPL